MSKIFVFLSLFGFVSTAFSWSSYDPNQVYTELYQPYFDALKLQYETPRGCSGASQHGSTYNNDVGTANCALAADFNGDGNQDYAVLLEYIGGDLRFGNRYLDLVVLYFSKDKGEVRHSLFTHMGKVNDRGKIDTFLSIQPTGELELPSGIKRLDKPGINLLKTNGKNDNPWAYPTIYWSGEKFYSITKATD